MQSEHGFCAFDGPKSSKENCTQIGNVHARQKGLVDHIFFMKETYFVQYPDATKEAKDNYIAEKVREASLMIEDCLAKATERDDIHKFEFLKARLLNIPPAFDPEAEKIMTKFVKFHPKDEVAWNILGEIFWKKKDYENARNCFAGSQVHVKNLEGLINLSLLLRDLPCKTPQERLDNINLSIQKAREAVAMDINKGKPWYIMGNAYLNLYFITAQLTEHLQQALKAYQQAEKDPQCQYMAEFYYNKGMACRCARYFLSAINSFDKARQLDPAWKRSSDQYEALLIFLNNITTFSNNKGGLPERRLKQFMTSLNDKLLGPYSGGTAGSSRNDNLMYTMLKNLTVGRNDDKVVLGKVVCHVFDPEPLSFTFCMIDEEGTCFVVTIFNIAREKSVIIGNSVAIARPLVEDFDFEFQEKHYKFQWIYIKDPLLLVVNGKYVSSNFRSKLEAVSTFHCG